MTTNLWNEMRNQADQRKAERKARMVGKLVLGLVLGATIAVLASCGLVIPAAVAAVCLIFVILG